MNVFRRAFLTLLALICNVLPASCSPRLVGPTPAMTERATAEAHVDDPGESTGQEENPAGGYIPPNTTEAIADWWGVIEKMDAGAQYDDYFERQDLGQVLYFGIDSRDPAVEAQIEALRGTGTIVHLYGVLVRNVPDYNGCQILVERIKVDV